MVKINIKSSKSKYTSIPNIFIDEFMPQANGEFVKIYLYLFKISKSNDDSKKNISSITADLGCTSLDIIRALKYWETKNIICDLSFNSKGELLSFSFCDLKSNLTKKNAHNLDINFEQQLIQSNIKEDKKQNNITINEELLNDKNIKDILFIAESYFSRPLNNIEMQTLVYIHTQLNFCVDLIDYLIDYCVGLDKKNINYIKKVAMNWKDLKIITVEEAKQHNEIHNKNYFIVKKIFNLNRPLLDKENEYINKWAKLYNMSSDLIKEACNITISSINKPNFEYANSIIKTWVKNKIKTLKDVNNLKNKKTKKTNFSKYETRDYNYEGLENQVLFN